MSYYRKKSKLIIFIISAAIFILSAGILYYTLFVPSNEHIEQYDVNKINFTADGKIVDTSELIVENGKAFFSYKVVKEYIDSSVWWDQKEAVLTVLTKDGIKRFTPSNNDGITHIKDTVYISDSFIKQTYNYDIKYISDNNLYLSLNREAVIGKADVKDKVEVRKLKSIKSPIVYTAENESLYVLEKSGSWFLVVSESGEKGYIKERGVSFSTEKGNLSGRYAPNGMDDIIKGCPLKTDNGRISLVWEAVYKPTIDIDSLPVINGLDVVSPTWFELEDSEGGVKSLAYPEYVNWAHDNGYKVWAVAANNFQDPDMTIDFLYSSEARSNYINSLIQYAGELNLDGFNIDFEYMYVESMDAFSQLVRELSYACRLNSLTLSVDVTVLSTSGMWSRCYDRLELAKACDYVMVMFYDQHTGSSEKAGSVGQVSWADSHLPSLLELIPKEKLIFGMPFYTRLWAEKEIGGKVELSSEVYSMRETQNLIAEKGLIPVWDSDSGQDYIEYSEGGITYKMWAENSKSISERMALVTEYGLAGTAAWNRGYETPDVWEIINE